MNPSTIWILGQLLAVFVVTRNLLFWYPIWQRHPDSVAAWDRYRTEWVRLGFSLLGLLVGVLSFWLTVDRWGWGEAFVWALYPEPAGEQPFIWQRTVILWGLIAYGQGWTVVSILTRRVWNRVGDYSIPSPDQIQATAEKTAAVLKVITDEDAAQIKRDFDEAVNGLMKLGEATKAEAQRSYQEANHVNEKIENLNEQIEAINNRLLSVIAADKKTVDRIDETTIATQETTTATDEYLREKLDT